MQGKTFKRACVVFLAYLGMHAFLLLEKARVMQILHIGEGVFLYGSTLLLALVALYLLYSYTRPLGELVQALQGFREKKWEDFPLLFQDTGDIGEISRSMKSLYFRTAELMKKTRHFRKEKRILLEEIPLGVIILDEKKHVESMNIRAKKIVLWDHKLPLGKPIEGYFTEKSLRLKRVVHRLLEESAETGERCEAEMHLHEDGNVKLTVASVPMGKEDGYVITLCDQVSGQASIEMGKEFIANASHELRTPATIIKGFVETLRDIPQISEEMFDSILEKILRNCERMESLVKNLLTLADIDHVVDMKKEACNLALIIENCSYQILNIAPDAYIETLINRDEIFIHANKDLIELALMNLLQNAVKYSKEKPRITVTIEQKEDCISLTIEDQGIGIPEESLSHIFDRFYTVNKSHARKLGGAGLGLSMVKVIIEKHGATINVESQVGKGTKFILVFPAHVTSSRFSEQKIEVLQ